MRFGVDFSQHGGALAASTVECWKAKGITHAVVQYSERMRQHLDVLHQAGGIEVEAYVYLYWGLSPWQQTPQDRTRAALAMAGGRITRLWLDAEDSSNPYREDQLAECVAICEAVGMPTGIYTGRWWWVPRTRNSQAFRHLPLWHAEYTINPPADLGNFASYGGWARPVIWQYQGTTTLCGHSVDLNALEDEPANPPVQPEPLPEEDEAMQRVNGIFHTAGVPFDWPGFRVAEPVEVNVAQDLQETWQRYAIDASKVVAIQLDLFIASGTVTVMDGDGAWAGKAGYRPTSRSNELWQGRVNIQGGKLRLDGKGKLAMLGVSGIYTR